MGMMGAVLAHLHNRFGGTPVHGTFTATAGSISGSGLSLSPNQYYWVDGSTFNDGLHQCGTADLVAEAFEGTVTPCRIPSDLSALVDEIEQWCSEHGGAAADGLQSESFGGYSYTRATDPRTGAPMTWQGAYRSQLNQWRKL